MTELARSNPVMKWRPTERASIVVAALALALAVSLIGNVLQWRSAATSGPRFDISSVSIAGQPPQLGLRIEYRNVGRQATKWLEIDTVNVVPELLSAEPASKSVMANPIPPGVDRTLIVPVASAPRAIAICARWLDRYYGLSSAHWYFSLGKDGNGAGPYVEPAPEYFSVIDRLNPCTPPN